jgi:hypothetical protein
MTGAIWWKSRRRCHLDIESVVHDAVFHKAQTIAVQRYTDDIRGTEDAINANLGSSHHEKSPYYSSLTAKIALHLSEHDMRSSLEYHNSLARVERLRFLKSELYNDPSMLLIDFLDRNPDRFSDPPDFADFQRLALKVSNGDKWWSWILDVLDKFSSEVSDENGNTYVMKVLFAALHDAAPDIFNSQQTTSH